MSAPFLQLEAIEKSFDQQPILRGVSLTVAAGEIVVLLGPSGCGKTTLLRIIAGLETPDHGRLLLQGTDISQTAVHQRGFGFVFQDYALFPHKNVADNVAFGLRMQKWAPDRIQAQVQQALAQVDLAGFERRLVHELSGGEQQRVALARSLAPAPRLLLLDEPLGALDRALRERLMLDLRPLLQKAGQAAGQPHGMTAIYVTHDQAEAFAIANRVAIMRKGRIEQIGTPQAIYGRPASPFVARFLGMENIIEGTVVSQRPWLLQTAVGPLQLAAEQSQSLRLGQSVSLLLRPDAAELSSDGPNVVEAELLETSFRGRYQIITVRLPSTEARPLTFKFELDTAVVLPPPHTSLKLALAPQALVPLETA